MKKNTWATIVMLMSFAFSSGRATMLQSSFDIQVPLPPTPVVVEGKSRLAYELHLTNFANQALKLKCLRVLDSTNDREIAVFRDEAFDQRLGRPGLPSGSNKNSVAPGMRAIVYLEIDVDPNTVPKKLRHRLEYQAEGHQESTIVESAATAVLEQTNLILQPPLRGGPWVAIYDPSWERGHRRMFYAIDGRTRLPGRYAIDWILLDPQGHYTNGEEDDIHTWYGYGADVFAVANGMIAAVRDGIQESPFISAQPKHSLSEAAGNYVVLDLGQGKYAFYEHLKPGSIRVQTGEMVHCGQIIAALGFTGDSTGPHLHFHVADGNSPLEAEGIPYVFQNFKMLGVYDSMEQFGKQPWNSPSEQAKALHTAEFPSAKAVAQFDQAEGCSIH